MTFWDILIFVVKVWGAIVTLGLSVLMMYGGCKLICLSIKDWMRKK